MNLYITDKAIWCKVFPTSLKEGMLSWFTQLSPNSVESFKTFSTKFSTQYATSRPHRMSSIALLNIRQKKGEPLRAFMESFRKISQSIKNLMPEIAMHNLISTLQPGQFTDSLIKKSTKNLDEFWNQETKFKQNEELCDFHKNARAKSGGDK
ncbi:uncharacterized protein [Phaseolus vulgaris]|uniref:uncharacterized protein n=1 Tax=Phaseolus vulgaris TaxID=3885 RepID=UPI0035CB2E48